MSSPQLEGINVTTGKSPSPPPAYDYQPAPAKFSTVNDTHVDPPSALLPIVSDQATPQLILTNPSSSQQPAIIGHQQSTNTNVVVVQSQPMPRRLYLNTVPPVGDHYLTLSTLLTVLCVLCGTWYGLFCTIPAIYFSILAREADQRGDMTSARSHARVSLSLNIVSVVVWVILSVVTIGIVIAFVNNANTGCSRNYDGTYYCY